MKVAYSVATKFGGSGIGNTAYNAVCGIYQVGYLERVFCSSFNPKNVPANLFSSTGTSFFERLRFLPSSYQWFLKDISHDLIVTTLLYSNVVKPFDIFHVWNGHGLMSLRKARKMGARIVVERASSHPLTFESIMNKEYKKRGLKFSQMIFMNRKRLLQEFRETDYITVPSDFSYQSMIENGVSEEKLVKLSFGVDSEYFRPSNKAHEGFNVLFVGQVGFRKGVLYLLEAWKKLGLKDAKLRILGQEDSEIKHFLAPFRNDPSIEFLGYGNSLDLYQNSDVFVLPSLEEGSALVTYEASACGLPVITTYESGSVVSDNQDGFIVKSKDSLLLAEKLEYLYNNRSVLKGFSENARKKAEQFSWYNYGARLVQFYGGTYKRS